MDETSTLSDEGPYAPASDAREWTLTVVHHRDPDMIGLRRVVPDGARHLLGRAGSACLPGAFDDERVSRKHAEVQRRGDRITVSDLDSRNGTTVNGQPVEGDVALTDGDLIGVGEILLLLHRTRISFREPKHPELLGIGAGLAAVLEQITLVAPRKTTVLIVGETGAGKELVAREIHARSTRKDGPLVAINCAGLTDTLLASELFGHVRGAFTGADRPRKGLIEAARGGTLFLDEITEASPGLQASLLRLFETGEYRPVGSDRIHSSDVRFIAAAQPDIDDRIEEGRFRLDLWTRLARWELHVPPLRERPEDIPMLAAYFAEQYARRRVKLSTRLVIALTRHRWRGNVRELQATMERLVVGQPDADVLAPQPWLVERFEEEGEEDGSEAQERPPASPEPAKRKRVTQPPREELVELLRRHDGRIRAAARDLGVSRKSVYRWVDALDIDLDRIRED